jgi:soluble cytochrome b562
MKNTLHSLAALLFLATVALAPAASSHAASPDDQTELGARMEKLNAPWRKLRRQVADPAKNTASLELLAKIREAAKGAEQLTPAMAADLPADRRAKFQADYAAGMKKFADYLDALEAALKAGDNAAAAKVVAAIASHQREAHKAFRKEEDK